MRTLPTHTSRSRHHGKSPLTRAVSLAGVAALAIAMTSCGGEDTESAASSSAVAETMSPGAPEETVYGFIQAMAAGDLQAACAFHQRPDADYEDSLPVAATDEPDADERYADCVEDLSGDDDEAPGTEAWLLAADVPMGDYEVSEDAAFDQMEVQLPGDWSAYEEFDGFWELKQLDTDIVKYQDDDAWYLYS